MIHGRKMALVGLGMIAIAAVLVSFTGRKDDEKMKRYQVIHHEDGKMVEYDTILPMSSTYSVDDFLAEKGIESDNIEIIEMSAGAEGHAVFIEEHGEHRKHHAEHIVIKEMGEDVHIESHDGKEVKMVCEIGEDGKMVTRKFVDGEEVEVSELDLENMEIDKIRDGEDHMVIKMRIDRDEHGEHMQWVEEGESVKIICEMDDEGNFEAKKFVNGEEVELTPEEIEKLKMHKGEHGQSMVIKIDGDELSEIELEELSEELENLEIELEGLDKEIEIEIEKILEEVEELEGLEREHHVMVKTIEIDGDEEGLHEEIIIMDGDKEFDIHSDGHEMRVISGHDENFTVVIVTNNYDPSKESKEGGMKIRKEMKSSDVSIYPNPTSGVVNIRLNQTEKVKTRIEITDVTGKVVFKDNLGKFSGEYSKEIDLKQYGAGTYIINIEQGGDVRTEKVVVK